MVANLRIAIFTETYLPYVSGVVTHIKTLKNELKKQGHSVLIVAASNKASLRHSTEEDVLYCPSIPLKKIYGAGLSNPLNILSFRRIKEFNPDIIHVHTEFTMGIFALFAAKYLKVPVVYTLHTMYDDYLFYIAPKRFEKLLKPAAHYYFKNVASHATEIIGPSKKVVEFLRRCGVERHINIIPNTVDLTEFLPENNSEEDIKAVKEKLGIAEQDTVMCFVGRLGKEKSIDLLINNFYEGFRDCHNLKLMIIGDGPNAQSLSQQVQMLGLSQNIKLLGKIEHSKLAPYYHACDIFITCSVSEMNSISMLESMASGLYNIQRLDIYNRDQLKEGVNGDYFETSQEMKKLIERYISLSSQQKEAVRKKVTASTREYTEEVFCKKVLNVYQIAIDRYLCEKKAK